MAVLPLRLVAFALVQALVALTLAASGDTTPWTSSAAWWPVVATATNVLTVIVVVRLLRRDGRRYRDLFTRAGGRLVPDLLATLALAVAMSVLVVLPNLGLATWLFGDPEAPLDILVQPLPAWAAWTTLIAFPVTIALAELPFYFGVVQPRLVAVTPRPIVALVLTAAFLAAQHATLPLVFDGRFILWRALMFLPLAALLAVALRWRPRLLPYVVVLHGLADLQIAAMIFAA